MSLIFGIASRAGEAIGADWLASAQQAAEGWPADRQQQVAGDRLAAFCKQMDATPWASHSSPIVSDDTATVLFDGRLDNRADLAAQIGQASAEGLSDGQLTLAAWHALGDDLPRHLIGDFAVAIHLHQTGELLLIRDHLGVRPLFVCQSGDFVAFSSTMPPLLALPFCDGRWNAPWVVDYLEEVKPDAEYTAFRGIRAVPPAHVLRFGPEGEQRERYWSLSPSPAIPDITEAEAVAHALTLFERAVNDRLVTGQGRVASELSGGLDSSSIAVAAATLLDGQGEALIGVTQALQSDFQARYGLLSEQPFADAVYDHCPAIERLDVFNRTDDLLAMLRQTVAVHGAPPRNDFNGLASEAPQLLEERGVRVLLSGFGGDQLVTAGSGGLVDSLLADRDWRGLASFVRRGSGRLHRLVTALRGVPLIGALLPAHKPRLRVTPNLANDAARSATGYPQRAGLHQASAYVGTMQQRDLVNVARPVMAYRLQDSQVGAGVMGLEYRYPLLDVRLIEFVHSLPARWRSSPGVPRRLIRRMMGARLPEKVRERRDKFGMTVPGVFVNVTLHAAALRDHVAAVQGDPVAASYADFREVLKALDATLELGEFPKMSSIIEGDQSFRRANQGQVLRLALLGLWQQAGGGEAVPVGAAQPNQTE